MKKTNTVTDNSTRFELDFDQLAEISGGGLPTTTLKDIYSFVNSDDLSNAVSEPVKTTAALTDSITKELPGIWNKIENTLCDIYDKILNF